jgi:site-specific recombinase XerD
LKSKGSDQGLEFAVKMFLLDRKIAGCTVATVEAYQAQFTPFQKWVVDHKLTLEMLREADIRSFLLFRQGVSQATLHAATVRLKTFFKWSAEQDYCADLMAKIRKPKLAMKVINALTVEEIRSMLVFCRSNGYIGKRDEALIRFLLDTGARISEALDLTQDRLDLDAGRALLNGKGQKQRYVFFGPKTTRALLRYFAAREKARLRSSVVFVNHDGTAMNRRHACQTITRLGRKANIREKRVSPHTLRHSSALLFLKRGGDSLSLQRLLGHTTLAMTNRYLGSISVDDLEIELMLARFGGELQIRHQAAWLIRRSNSAGETLPMAVCRRCGL